MPHKSNMDLLGSMMVHVLLQVCPMATVLTCTLHEAAWYYLPKSVLGVRGKAGGGGDEIMGVGQEILRILLSKGIIHVLWTVLSHATIGTISMSHRSFNTLVLSRWGGWKKSAKSIFDPKYGTWGRVIKLLDRRPDRRDLVRLRILIMKRGNSAG